MRYLFYLLSLFFLSVWCLGVFIYKVEMIFHVSFLNGVICGVLGVVLKKKNMWKKEL
ncbi:hypothetical protein P278_05180 [Zhouia amylolytica AD3]|uniref:Uncharacterized protein n=1 Tax=Zhouia amylolytica AD3 TaxID=1286632 RepID=W2UUP7_9FLAO|nr:hypothetical protein P278_05180 [Zhouia amylolytica AD3]